MQTNDIMVSVICTAYNHEKYIVKCLDGFINQKTNFKFEVLINDDASTDNTAKIIREYETMYPDIIKPFYQEKNLCSQKIPITKSILFPNCRGKYIALCEGDDYWTDENKLQSQFDALENNPSCHFCVCKTQIVKENEMPLNRFFPSFDIPEGIIGRRKFMDIIKVYSFHTSSYFFRRSLLKKYFENTPDFRKVSDVGDEPYLLYFGYHGDVYYINKNMSSYRTDSVSSWSKNERSKKEKAVKHCKCMIKMIQEFDKYSYNEFHDICEKRILIQQFAIDYINENYKTLLSKSYREIYKTRPVKEKIIILTNVFFPRFYPSLLKIYKRLKND